MNVLNWLVAKFDNINNWFLRIGFVCLFAMLVIDTLNIISRKVGFGAWVPGGKEIIEELMVVTVYCGVAFVALRREHIKTEVVQQHSPPKLRLGSEIFGQVVVASVCFLLLWRSIALCQDKVITWPIKQGLIDVPQFPAMLVMCMAFVLLFISTMLVLVKTVADRKTSIEEEHLPEV